jgi:hypothetical protein
LVEPLRRLTLLQVAQCTIDVASFLSRPLLLLLFLFVDVDFDDRWLVFRFRDLFRRLQGRYRFVVELFSVRPLLRSRTLIALLSKVFCNFSPRTLVC